MNIRRQAKALASSLLVLAGLNGAANAQYHVNESSTCVPTLRSIPSHVPGSSHNAYGPETIANEVEPIPPTIVSPAGHPRPPGTPAGLVASPARQRELLAEIKAKRVQAPAPGGPGNRVSQPASSPPRSDLPPHGVQRPGQDPLRDGARLHPGEHVVESVHATRAESLETAHGFGNRIWMAGLWLWRPEPPLSCLWPGWPRLCSDEWLLNRCKTTPSQ